ncbi:MAG: hypothetical protein HYV09_16290 [Deltaproteobacteria bacterium]|nr:hypothetical protein [Deltaproteobacteria bacterium]
MARSKWLLATVGLGAVLMFGSAAAQTSPAGTVDVKAPSVTSPADQATLADQYVAKMQVSATRVRHLLDEARRAKDVVKTTCLSDKLAQIEVALKSARDRTASLKAAIARGDTDVRNHEFSVMNVLRQRAEQLDAEANQCIGEELGFPGETRSTFTIDPNIAPIDPGAGSDPGIVVVLTPPNQVSPTR